MFNGITSDKIEHVQLREKLEAMLMSCKSKDTVHALLCEMRNIVLANGLPNETPAERNSIIKDQGGCSLRGRIWKAFFRIDKLSADMYLKLLNAGPSTEYSKICLDMGRVFPTSKVLLVAWSA